MVSSDLVWQIVRNRSCYLKKQKSTGIVLTSEPFNPTAENKYKYSGIAARNAVGMVLKNGKISVKSRKDKRKSAIKPKNAITTRVLSYKVDDAKKKLSFVSKSRPDLYGVLLKRYYKLRSTKRPVQH
eukprot:GHVR01107633.1.p1 GENE.GHVR01107633.1~~GHVR01107633.1.p1  ORF type:complete len:127 (+),score=15.60 GHVR01107633.1:88-468(+)